MLKRILAEAEDLGPQRLSQVVCSWASDPFLGTRCGYSTPEGHKAFNPCPDDFCLAGLHQQ